MADVTVMLQALERGDAQAAEQLLPLVYEELRRLAARKLAQESPGHTLDATALVHEAYVRLVGSEPDQPWDGRAHFFGAAAEAMRRILVDNARRRRSLKRGGEWLRQPLDEQLLALPEPREDLVALDEALDQLTAKDPRKAQLVKLRYFGGLKMDEAAKVLGVSLSSAEKDWSYAKAWLFRAIKQMLTGAEAVLPKKT